MPFLPPNQQCQSTEGNWLHQTCKIYKRNTNFSSISANYAARQFVYPFGWRNYQGSESDQLHRKVLVERSDVQRQLKFRGERALAEGAVPARVTVHDAHVLREVAAARERLVATRAVGDGDRSGHRPATYLRQVLGRLPAVHGRHVLAEEGGGVEHGVALRAVEPVVELPHVQREGHAAPEELRALGAVELDPAVHEVAVLVQVRAVDEGLPANVAGELLFRRQQAVVRRLCLGAVEHRVTRGAAQIRVVRALVPHQRVDPFEHRRAHVARKLGSLVVDADVAPQVALRGKRLIADVAGIRFTGAARSLFRIRCV